MNICEYIKGRLFELRDEKYREFQCGLMPTVAPEGVIGVRTPALRALARELSARPDIGEFLGALPHKYYEENNLHGFIIETIKDYELCIAEIERFLPYIDNWATCDLISPKIFKKHTGRLIVKIREWLASPLTYTVRFGLEMLMSLYLDERFCPEYLELAAGVRSGEYYVRMMQAWYFATALAKQYGASLPYIEGRRLETWTHNKAIQKAVESRRLSPAQKEYLKTLKIKGR